jgi:hypothetical protein
MLLLLLMMERLLLVLCVVQEPVLMHPLTDCHGRTISMWDCLRHSLIHLKSITTSTKTMRGTTLEEIHVLIRQVQKRSQLLALPICSTMTDIK